MTNDDAINILRPIAERRMTFRLGNKAMQAIPDDIDRALALAIDALDRLAAYEETGLTPEEITAFYGRFCEARDIATALGMEYAERMDELAQADKEGRLVILPCKVGDEVWSAEPFRDGRPRRGAITVFEVDEDGAYAFWVSFGVEPVGAEFLTEDIGKTVFISREDAEAALGRADNGEA